MLTYKLLLFVCFREMPLSLDPQHPMQLLISHIIPVLVLQVARDVSTLLVARLPLYLHHLKDMDAHMLEIHMNLSLITLHHPTPKLLAPLISKNGISIILGILQEMAHSQGIQDPVHRVDTMETGKPRGIDKMHLTSARLIVVEVDVVVAEVVVALAGLLEEEATVATTLASTILGVMRHSRMPAL